MFNIPNIALVGFRVRSILQRYHTSQNNLYSYFIGWTQKRKFVTEITKKNMSDNDCQMIGDFKVHAWSLSGIESTVAVTATSESSKFKIAFDMGYATRQSVPCDFVFISHGHMDHIAGIVHHALKRNLLGMKPAQYYAPPHVVDTLREIARGYCDLQGDRDFIDETTIKPVAPGESIEISKSYRVKAFRTTHRVPSQGYIVYKTQTFRKQEYNGFSREEMKKLVKDGVNIHDVIEIPQLAYTGDTKADIFTDVPIPDLLKVKLLITESTYIDSDVKKDVTSVEKARERGHIHLKEIVDNSKAFDDVEHILLVHFSDKYSVGYIQRTVRELLKDDQKLFDKIHLATLMKEKSQ